MCTKIHFFAPKICTYQKKVVPLQRKQKKQNNNEKRNRNKERAKRVRGENRPTQGVPIQYRNIGRVARSQVCPWRGMLIINTQRI